ncbi:MULTISPECIES: hypothetical protein [unclassified Pseudoalteromonas]|jgi:hypothetical protein|uniref:hypothetical protein n=1 Tax=unclassified Pseudoalteromonas TaxID=194690 RepID=UPI0005A828CD|nr:MULTISPECIES: hypothetical protein [unclassified Pseudoalteromonas]MBU2968827.1 prephenate dehydrogenase [Pseudoalteromonas sp. C2R02]
MNPVIEQLNNNLKVLYRQALDADNQLDTLQKNGHAKFSALLKDPAFSFDAKRFKPYILDIASAVETLSKQDDLDTALLESTVVKLQKIHQLLANFNSK